ncbi:Protein involved in meta-pathway of phenol degradation [Acinetobacter baumannii]|nr:Protein involved in meta-pathway of phenol degradation [Acinetobacter baumannii]
MNNKISAIICGVISSLYLPSAFATENGSDSFALGAEGMMAGALPPAGVYLLSYYQNYHASEFQNGPNQFHVDVNAVVPRLVWMTDQKIMDGQLGFYAAQPLVYQRLKINGMADSNQGLGDLILGGMLGWHQGNHHWIAALETVLGTGEYDTPSATHPVEANLGKKLSHHSTNYCL